MGRLSSPRRTARLRLLGAALGCALASGGHAVADGATADAYRLNPSELDPIRFSRVESAALPTVSSRSQTTRLSFKLRPGDTAAGLYGFGRPRVDVSRERLGTHAQSVSLPEPHQGFSYSAGVDLEHDRGDIDGTAYVSSSLLGVSYGRMGRLWYGGVDFNIEQWNDPEVPAAAPREMLSLDLTTGRRMGLTGVSTRSPLWLLSLRGNFDVHEMSDDSSDVDPDWYLNPSLFWERPGFTFSAEVQVPMEREPIDESEEPDYRLRAIFEKQF